MSAEYLFPANWGYFKGTKKELAEFVLREQAEPLFGKGMGLCEQKVVSYEPWFLSDEEFLFKNMGKIIHAKSMAIEVMPIKWN